MTIHCSGDTFVFRGEKEIFWISLHAFSRVSNPDIIYYKRANDDGPSWWRPPLGNVFTIISQSKDVSPQAHCLALMNNELVYVMFHLRQTR